MRFALYIFAYSRQYTDSSLNRFLDSFKMDFSGAVFYQSLPFCLFIVLTPILVILVNNFYKAKNDALLKLVNI